MLSTLWSLCKAAIACVEHPKVLLIGFLVGYLTPSTVPNLLTGLLTLVNPLLGSLVRVAGDALSWLKSKV